MERATGIGGVFVRSPDPDALRAWYATHLGLQLEDFGSRDQQLMVNYRVRDLDAMLAQLRAAGVPVEEHVEEMEFGRFGWATDPDGNRFELWEPAADH